MIVKHTVVPLYTLNWSIVVHAYKIVITYLLILINKINIPVLSFSFKSKNRRPFSPQQSLLLAITRKHEQPMQTRRRSDY